MERLEQPLVSVIIPAYLAATRIRETLDSVFAQTYQNFEIVLVNDGSPDTEPFEQAIQGYGEGLIYLRQENRGPAAARNTAIRAARGKYVALLDSDDVYLPQHLARMVAFLEREGLDLACCDYRIVRNGAPLRRQFELQPQHPPVTFEKLLTLECAVGTSAAVASRQAMIDAGLFDERYLRCEDFDLWLRMAFRGARMGILNEVGMERRCLPNGLCSDSYLLRQAAIEVYHKTLTTLPLSAAQQKLIRQQIAWTEGMAEMEIVKRSLWEGRYAEARQAANRATVCWEAARAARWRCWYVSPLGFAAVG